MFKPQSFFQTARKIINLRFAELNKQEASSDSAISALLTTIKTRLRESRAYPSLTVLVMGLAIVGLTSLIQLVWLDPNTQVRVTPGAPAKWEATMPALLKEPNNLPEGSPTAPVGLPVEIYPNSEEEAPGLVEPALGDNISPDWSQGKKPVQGQVVTAFGFGYAEFFDDYRLHGGIDFTAPKGSAVTAVLAGTIDAVYDDDLFGTMVVIDHGDGWQSLYAPLDDIDVIPGQWVIGGARLGSLGSPPPAEKNRGTHLHFELHHQGEPLDPTLYLK